MSNRAMTWMTWTTFVSFSSPSKMMKPSFTYLFLLFVIFLVCCVRNACAFAPHSVAATRLASSTCCSLGAPPSSSSSNKFLPAAPSSPCCALFFSKNKFQEQDSNYRNSVYGVNPERGPLLLGIVMLFCIWQFTIPVEFRRARFCSEQQVLQFPNSKCITVDNWIKNIQEYYQNGGGIQWDFSLEENEWLMLVASC